MRTAPFKIVPSLLAGFLFLDGAGELSGQTISDIAVSNVIVTVANHWQRTLADGSYPAATTLSQAQSATEPAGIEWDYPWGVNLYGQLRVKDATGNTNAENFALNHNLICARYYAWLVSLTNTLTSTTPLPKFQTTNAVLGTFFVLGKLDYCGSMTSQLLEGALRHGGGPTLPQLQMAMVTANYISTGQSRLPDGTLYRPTDQNAIWADDLFMSCPFLVRWYQYTGNMNFLDDAAQQVMNFAGYLQDTNGIWFHGYYVGTHSVNGIKWGRANGWATVATAEILSVMPTNHPARTNLLAILRRHIAGIESVQAPDGRWHQVLDHPEVWEETSCSAMFACSIARAVNRGWIDPTNMAVARRAFAAITQMEVSASGAISNICPGTSLSTSLPYYTNKISLPPSTDDPHGPGPGDARRRGTSARAEVEHCRGGKFGDDFVECRTGEFQFAGNDKSCRLERLDNYPGHHQLAKCRYRFECELPVFPVEFSPARLSVRAARFRSRVARLCDQWRAGRRVFVEHERQRRLFCDIECRWPRRFHRIHHH